LLTPRQAATALSISERLLWQLTHDKQIRVLRIGSVNGKARARRYRVKDLEAFLDKMQAAQAEVCPSRNGTN